VHDELIYILMIKLSVCSLGEAGLSTAQCPPCVMERRKEEVNKMEGRVSV
jgi:hypothetical protein